MPRSGGALTSMEPSQMHVTTSLVVDLDTCSHMLTLQLWCRLRISASKSFIRRFIITEKAPTRAFSLLKAATTAFTFKTLLRHYAKQALTPRSLNVRLGPRRNYHKGRVAIRHYATNLRM